MSGDGLAAVVLSGVEDYCSHSKAFGGQVGRDGECIDCQKIAAHVAEQIRAHLSAVLGEAREDVARALRGVDHGNAEPIPWDDLLEAAQEMWRADADAALAVIGAALGLEVTKP